MKNLRPISAVTTAAWRTRGLQRAFSLVEIMIVVALMSVIILGLMAMFNQTQRAFRLGMSQTDVLESGRLATDMISRELAQISPSELNSANPNWVNFYTAFPSGNYTPLAQPLTDANAPWRTNVIEDLFFITRENQQWTGVGYYVRTNASFGSGRVLVGTLYRFETNTLDRFFKNPPLAPPGGFWNAYVGASNNASISRIMDGVVHFRVRAYDSRGELINGFVPRTNVIVTPSPNVEDQVSYAFVGGQVPAYVEVELGILEPQTFERLKSIPDINGAPLKFLANQAGRVHLFRQRIPVRSANPVDDP